MNKRTEIAAAAAGRRRRSIPQVETAGRQRRDRRRSPGDQSLVTTLDFIAAISTFFWVLLAAILYTFGDRDPTPAIVFYGILAAPIIAFALSARIIVLFEERGK